MSALRGIVRASTPKALSPLLAMKSCFIHCAWSRSKPRCGSGTSWSIHTFAASIPSAGRYELIFITARVSGAEAAWLPRRSCEIYLGVSKAEKIFLESRSPHLFDHSRAFFPVGFPKADALLNGVFQRDEVLAQLKLPERCTILITSHYRSTGTLRFSRPRHIRKKLPKSFRTATSSRQGTHGYGRKQATRKMNGDKPCLLNSKR